MKIDKILKEVLKKIVLTDKEIAFIKKKKLDANIGGSLAKDTLVRKAHQDVDIFVSLDKEKIADFENLVKKTGLEFETVHGSRDYINIKREGIIFELIHLKSVPSFEKFMHLIKEKSQDPRNHAIWSSSKKRRRWNIGICR